MGSKKIWIDVFLSILSRNDFLASIKIHFKEVLTCHITSQIGHLGVGPGPGGRVRWYMSFCPTAAFTI